MYNFKQYFLLQISCKNSKNSWRSCVVYYVYLFVDFLNNQLIVGIVGGLVVPMSCIVAMTCYV